MITSPLCLCKSCHQDGAALAPEIRKLHSNGPKCHELGWSCIPLAVETYGNWDAQYLLEAGVLPFTSSPKSSVVAEIRQSHPSQGAPTLLTVISLRFVYNIFMYTSTCSCFHAIIIPRASIDKKLKSATLVHSVGCF